MSPLRIVPLTEELLGEAALLAAGRVRAERRHVPHLPARYENFGELLPLIRRAYSRAPGVAAIDGDRLVGFMTTNLVHGLRGPFRGAYVGEWGHAVAGDIAGERRQYIYRRMYELLGEKWVRNGCFAHAVTIFAHDQDAVNAWFWSHFGMACVDAVRGVEPIGATVHDDKDFYIRQATLSDLESVATLKELHSRYMAESPIFMPAVDLSGLRERVEKWMSQESHFVYLAFRGDKPIAYMQWEPSYKNASFIITDPKTASVTGAFTLEEHRGGGVGSALLDEVLRAARARGFERCSVDFESHNIYGSRFWLRYFQPICYSVFRQVDERIAWAPHDRRPEHIW